MQVVDKCSFKACSHLNNTSSVHAVPTILLILFFLSGICGLIYEVVWGRMLTLVIGQKEGVQCIR